MSRYNNDCKVYVGDLGNNASKKDLESTFREYGSLRSVWVARNPPGFAFVEFEDSRDAEDAVHALDGRTICGRRARVEMSNVKTGRYRGPGFRSRGRPFHPDDKCYECGERGHYARDCDEYRRGGRYRSRSYTRSRSRGRRSYSRSYSRSRSRTPRTPKRSRSKSGSCHKKSRSGTPSQSPPKNGAFTETK